MGKINNFEELRAWQHARELVKFIYMDFANCKDWGFKNQIQNASVSIMNNMAEGFERKSDKEFSRFLDISKGSCGEVRSMYYSAEDLKYVSVEIATKRRQQAKHISGEISGLMNYLKTTTLDLY